MSPALYPVTTSLRVIKELQWVKEITKGVTPTSPIFTAIPTDTFFPRTRVRSVRYRKIGTQADISKTILDTTRFDLSIAWSPVTAAGLLESMINLTGTNNRDDTYTFLLSQEHNESGTLVEKYQIARGCTISSVTIKPAQRGLLRIGSKWMATSISDWSLAHGLTAPTFATPLTATPWSTREMGTGAIRFTDLPGQVYDMRTFLVTINHNTTRTHILDAFRTVRIDSSERDIEIDVDIIYKDDQISESVKSFIAQEMKLQLHVDNLTTDVAMLTFTDVRLEEYDETVAADNTRAKVVKYIGTAGSVLLTIESLGRANSIQKYHILKTVAPQTSIHKYAILKTVLATSVHKYNATGIVSRTSIHKYNLEEVGIVISTLTQKYAILQNALATSIQKYSLVAYALQSSIQKYNLLKNILQPSIHKYNLTGIVSANSIQKYNMTGNVAQTSIQKYNIVAPSETRLYLHNATNSTSGLPTAEQSTTWTADKSMEGSQTTNRQMTKIIGTSQASISGTPTGSALQQLYFTRFVSPPLNMSSISANTWTYNFSTKQSDAGCNFPVDTGNAIRIICYVWRPSSSTKIGTIADGTSTAVNITEPAANTQKAHHTTFSGSSVSSMASGDVIIFEVWFEIDPTVAGGSGTITYYYDGTTANTTNDATVSNHASFIETPQTLTFV